MMEVVGLGLCRTGTQSLADSLTALGYGTTYHMREVMMRGEIGWWTDRMKAFANNDTANLPTAAELHEKMAEFRGVCDVPPALFVTELLDAYPDAKLIMTIRPVDKWVNSMKNHLMKLFGSDMAIASGTNLIADAMNPLWDYDIEKNGPAFFEQHYQKVREECAKRGREILEIDVSHPDSWQRLCEYLGKEAPEGMTTFPNSDFLHPFKERLASGDPAKEREAIDELFSWHGKGKPAEELVEAH